MCAQRSILTVRFTSFSTNATPTASQAALGVCVHDSTRVGVVFRFICAKIEPRHLLTGYHHRSSTIFSTDGLDACRHSPTLGQLLLVLESASIRAEARRHHLLYNLTPVLQFCALSSFLLAPMLCLGPLDLSPHSLGLSSSPGSGGCSSCALLCALRGRMSACRTRPAANPGGPQGGAQTGRSPGGGAGRKLSRPRSETKCCGGFPGTPPGPFRLSERTHGDTTGDQNSEQ